MTALVLLISSNQSQHCPQHKKKKGKEQMSTNSQSWMLASMENHAEEMKLGNIVKVEEKNLAQIPQELWTNKYLSTYSYSFSHSDLRKCS